MCVSWIQHVTPLQPSRSSSNSFRTRVIDIGERVTAFSTGGIEIGLASKLDTNRATPHQWKKSGCHYSILNGGIYHRLAYPLEFVERGEPNIGERVTAFSTGGIEIGLASKLDTNRATPHQWKKSGCHYSILNGGIYHRLAYPLEFVERGEPNDVIEWTISCTNKDEEGVMKSANKDEGRGIKTVILKINGEIKGEPMIIEGEDDLFPTLHINSSGAKVESGYQDILYSKKIQGKAEILFYSYQISLHKYKKFISMIY